jgi:pimeloyl-ACP methyl ester carboxylesterase
MSLEVLLIAGFLAIGLEVVESYKPVVIIHGLKQAATSLSDIDGYIKAAHPGTVVTVLDLYERGESYEAPMLKQVEDFGDAIKKISDANLGGFHLIGFSQGGLIARGVLEVRLDALMVFSKMGEFKLLVLFADCSQSEHRHFHFAFLSANGSIWRYCQHQVRALLSMRRCQPTFISFLPSS